MAMSSRVRPLTGNERSKLKTALRVQHDPYAWLLALPTTVKRRVRALRKLQLDSVRLEVDFYRQLAELEANLASRQALVHKERSAIVNGLREPADDEAHFPLFSEAVSQVIAELGEAKVLDAHTLMSPNVAPLPSADCVGVPNFWLQVLRNCDETADMIHPCDEPVLKRLRNVSCKEYHQPMKFVLEFHFGENAYFTNGVLTKEYEQHCDVDDSDPFDFDGPSIIACHGCNIHWKHRKNVTSREVKKRQKRHKDGSTRVLTKTARADSFFNFFDPPTVPHGELHAADSSVRQLLEVDFAIGQLLRDRLVPRAALYYTGEIFDLDDDDEDGDSDSHADEHTESDH